MDIQPITPEEAKKAHADSEIGIPAIVFKVFNDILSEKYSSCIKIYQDDVIDRIIVEDYITREDIFKNHWLDIEYYYRNAGWSVEYDKPGFNEFYKPYWLFKKKSANSTNRNPYQYIR